jgi:transforming growth factor-beta-induced protein
MPRPQDLKFDGGVVQIIDTLLIPPTNLTDTANAFNLTAFEGALYAAGIIDTALYTPNVTIFVSANEGFQALGPAITSMTSQELAKVLEYTILPQIVYSPGLTNNTKFVALNGENITIMHNGNNLYVNSAQLLTPDILIANGVMHVIDNVLNPQGPNAQPNPQIGTQAPVFASASLATNLPFTNSIPCTVSCPVTTSSAASSSGTGSVTGNATFTSVFSSSSRAQAAVARETGFGAAGLVAALGGALLMV